MFADEDIRTLAVSASNFIPFLKTHPALRHAFIVYGQHHYIDHAAPHSGDAESAALFDEVYVTLKRMNEL